MEINKRIKEISTWFEIDTLEENDKINYIKNLFDRGTLKNSLYADELIILNEKYGIYSNGKTYQFCEYTKIKENNPEYSRWYGGEEYIYLYEYKWLKEATYEDVINILEEKTKEKCNKILEEKTKEYDKKRDIYVELEFKKRTAYFYLEYYGECYSIEIDRFNHDNAEIFIQGTSISNKKYYNLKDELDSMINKKMDKYLEKGIKKIKNGYIYDNEFYENIEDIKIEEVE